MPGFIHRLFGKDVMDVDCLQNGECPHFTRNRLTWLYIVGDTVWSKGTSDGWYYTSKVGIIHVPLLYYKCFIFSVKWFDLEEMVEQISPCTYWSRIIFISGAILHYTCHLLACAGG